MVPVIGFLCEECGLMVGGRICESGRGSWAMIREAMRFGRVLVKCPNCGHENVLTASGKDERELN